MKKLLLAITLVSQLAIYGQQKVYADRTTFHGIEAPTGQEYQVVVDSLGKLKSEAKPAIPTKTSDLTNDSGFVTSSSIPAPQSFDDVLGIDNKTNKEAGFIDNNKNTAVNPEGMTVTDEDVGSSTQINSDSIELKKELGAGKATIVSYEEAVNTEHTLQAKSGTIAHLSDVLTLVYNQNKKNTQTATNTTVAVRMNDVTTGSLLLTPDMMTIGKTLYFEAYGETDLTAPDKMSFFISLGGEDVEIPIDIGIGSAYVAHSYNIKGYIDFTDGANEEREFNFSGELRINVDMSSSGIFLPFTYQIPTTTLEIDATSAKGFIIDVQHETTNTTTTCYKSVLKQLN